MIRRAARAERTMLLAVGLLVLVTSFLAAAVPMILTTRYDDAVQERLRRAVPGSTDLVIQSDTGQVREGALLNSAGYVTGEVDQLRQGLPDRLQRVVGRGDVWAASAYGGLAGRSHQSMSVGLSSSLDRHILYVSGRSPGGMDAHGVLETAISVSAARTFGVKVGGTLVLRSANSLTVRVTGLYRARDPNEPYWATHRLLRAAEVTQTRDGGTITLADGVIGFAGYNALCTRTRQPVHLTWTYSPVPGRVSAADVTGLVADVQEADYTVSSNRIQTAPLTFDTGFGRLLAEVGGQVRTAETVLALALAGLLAVGLGVIALTGELLLGRLRPTLTVVRARGGSLWQLFALITKFVAPVALPAAALGYGAAALLVGGPPQPLSVATVLLVAAAAVPLPALLGARANRRTDGGERGDLASHRPSARRLVLEGLVVVLALTAAYLLRRRGLNSGADHGVDPFLSAMPVLLGLACGLLVLRAYPYPLRLFGRLTARGRSLVPFVGVARASRQSVAAALPLTVLLLATAVAGFSATVDASLSRTQRLGSWKSVGADLRLDSPGMTDQEVARIQHTAGVRASVPAQVIDTAALHSDGSALDTLTVVGIDLDAYRRLIAGTPLSLPPTRPGAGAPMLLTPAAAAKYAATPHLSVFGQAGHDLPVHYAGTIAGFPGQPAGMPLAVVPYEPLVQATGLGPTTLYVRGDITPAALTKAAGVAGAGVTSRTEVLRSMTDSALVRLIRTAFEYGAFALDAYCALLVLLILLAGERARGQTVAYLRTLGLTRRQARRLTLVELAPVVLIAAGVGWVLGLVLPRIVGAALDLRPYALGNPVTGYAPGATSTALFAGGLLVFGAVAVLADAARTGRRRLGETLRMGEEG